MLTLSIPGEPVAKGRPKASVWAGRVHMRTPERTATWEAGASMLLRNAWAGRAPLAEPVVVEVQALASRPKAMLPKAMGGSAPASRPPPEGRCWRQTKPDGDNVLKAVADALVKAGVLRDDVHVVRWVVESRYAALGEGPAVEVVMRFVEAS